MIPNRLLLVEDDSAIRFGIRDFFEGHDFLVDETESVRSGEAAFRATRPDVVISDYRLPDGTALDLLPRLKQIDATVPVIILTGHGTINLAVTALREGAHHFLTKPVELPALQAVVTRAVEDQRMRLKQLAGKLEHQRERIDPFLGTSSAIVRMREVSEAIARTDSSILILGETGSGKGVLARWLHENSARAEESFVNLNCAGLSPGFLETELFGHERGAFTGAVQAKVGLLEVAHRGTVFLDEIGDVDLQVQPKLLKVLEEKVFRRLGEVRDRRVDIRLVAATHQDLALLVQQKKFRSDLYFRVNTIPLSVPPLRERAEDVTLIARQLLSRFAADLGRGEMVFAEEAESALRAYSWPGNIRELRNVIERAVLLGSGTIITRRALNFDALAAAGAAASDVDLTLEEMEKRHVRNAIAAEQGSVERAARRLGVPRSTLYQKLKRYGIPSQPAGRS